MKKKLLCVSLAVTLLFCVLTSCTLPSKTPESDTTAPADEQNPTSASTVGIEELLDADDKTVPALTDAADTIQFSDTGVTASGEGVRISGKTATITKSGIYAVSGTSTDGSLVIDAADKGTVFLILDSLTLQNASTAPLSVQQAEKTVLTLPDGGKNTLTDSRTAETIASAGDEQLSALFASDDLTVNGSGSLTIKSTASDGINCRDTLKLLNATLIIDSGDDAIVGKDTLLLDGVTLQANAQDDGLKATNDTDSTAGKIVIGSGSYQIDAGCDGIQAETTLTIFDGSFQITTGGGSANASVKANGERNPAWGGWGSSDTQSTTAQQSDTASAKGLKAGTLLQITKGSFLLDTSDDSLHTNGEMLLSGGSFTIQSGDDGMHADTALKITGGTYRIEKSYEGIESTAITVSGGTGHIVASDDGFNVSGGNDGSALGGRPGENSFTGTGETGDNTSVPSLDISGGSFYVNADGDGLDSNGSINMSGGTFYVDGPTNGGNGALDYGNTFTMTGGTLAAVGALGMVQTISEGSSVCCINASFSTQQNPGTLVSILNETGEPVLTLHPAKTFRSVVIASPELVSGKSYSVSYGGEDSKATENGFVSESAYTGGTVLGTASLNTVVTAIGSSAGSQFGGGPNGMGRPQF